MNKSYLLALNRVQGIGPRTIGLLQQQWPNLEDLFCLSSQALAKSGLSDKLVRLVQQVDLMAVKADLAWEKAQPNHHLITWDDANYPPLLKEIHDPPVVLYAIGDLSALQQPSIAIVGTRKPSLLGTETAKQFACHLAQHGLTIVSGLAYGIDAAAHRGCLDSKGKTIAVMGTGIDHIYPRAHTQLAKKISEHGLLLTEFPLKSAANAGHFPRRNRIISGLSLATLIVEAALKSGSLITARMALEQNRDVLAIPGSIHNQQARGCHYLLQQGAKLVTCVNDVLDEVGIPYQVKQQIKRDLPQVTNNNNLLQCIGSDTVGIDQLILCSGLSMEQITCGLAQLEIEGIVKATPRGYALAMLSIDDA